MYLELHNEHLHFSSITKDTTSGYFKHTTGNVVMLLKYHSLRCSNVLGRLFKPQWERNQEETKTVIEMLTHNLLIMYLCVSEQLPPNTSGRKRKKQIRLINE